MKYVEISLTLYVEDDAFPTGWIAEAVQQCLEGDEELVNCQLVNEEFDEDEEES